MTVNELRSRIRDAEYSTDKSIGEYNVVLYIEGRAFTPDPKLVIDEYTKTVYLEE